MGDIVDKRRGILAAAAASCAAVGGVSLKCASDSNEEAARVELVAATASDAQDFLAARTPDYRRALVVLYRRAIRTPCGAGAATIGPFYCVADERVYLDLGFFDNMPNSPARTFVVVHELGHHLERVLGQDTAGVQAELEADCVAGVWLAGRGERAADIAAVLAAAAAAGDDARGDAGERWSHGTASQRVAAVKTGLRGALAACTGRL